MLYSLVVFFFFKQKTAYEMRISDWSSDVCSSDLRRANEGLIVLQQSTYRDSPVPVEGHADVANRGVSGCVRDDHYAQGSHHRDRCDRVLQIGRASCRERVCQYV